MSASKNDIMLTHDLVAATVNLTNGLTKKNFTLSKFETIGNKVSYKVSKHVVACKFYELRCIATPLQ